MSGSSPAGAGGPRAKGRAPHPRSDQALVAVLHAAEHLRQLAEFLSIQPVGQVMRALIG
jgi:hypothetical protein